MYGQLHVHFLPSLTTPQELAGGTVAIIDVLRASTTIIYALAAGANQVIPCLEVQEAREIAAQLPGNALLGGERRGVPIEGFDLGNSPSEYTAERVANRTIVMTTTNGTRSLILCTGAERVLIAAFVNLSAVCRVLSQASNVHLLCAGTAGEITREDVLLAGAVVDGLSRAGDGRRLNDQSLVAADSWRNCAGNSQDGARLRNALRDSRGGRNLRALGQEHDIDLAAEMDKFDIVPELDRASWSIRVP